MKKVFNIPLAIIILVGVIVAGAQAQTSSIKKMSANIPFAFQVGKTTLPAGKYTFTVVNPASDRKVLQIRSQNGRSSAMVLTISKILSMSDNTKLVFERYGDQYFFAQAQIAGDPTGLAAVRRKGRSEKNPMVKSQQPSVIVIVAR